MFYSTDMSTFGNRLKEIRLNLNLSQSQVAEKSGINIDTLRKIENGYTIAKFETLLYLSEVYKIDLIHEMSKYTSDLHLTGLYISLDLTIINENTTEMDLILEKFDNLCLNNYSICIKTIEQLKLMTRVIRLRYTESKSYLYEAQHLIIHAIKLKHDKFRLDEFRDFTYSFIEIRLLFVLATVLGDARQCIESNDIINYVLTKLDHSIYSTRFEDSLTIKAYALLAYNYHRLDDHLKAIEYAQKGIDFSINKNCIETLPYLYLRKGVGEYFIQSSNHLSPLTHSINLLKATNKSNVAQQYIEILNSQYSIQIK